MTFYDHRAGYQRRSRFDVPLERSPGIRPDRFTLACIAAILAVTALATAFAFSAASDASASAHSPAIAEAGAGQGVGR